MSTAIKIFIIDDSAVVRQVLTELLNREPGFKVIGAASDPLFAQQRMQAEWPDVIVLDVEMPRMDGITFLKELMATRPTPVVICSTLTERGADTTLQALAAGAVDVITKPKIGLKGFLLESRQQMARAIRAAAQARVRAARPRPTAAAVTPPPSASLTRTTDQVVAIGTSTGGTQALESLLVGLEGNCPGIVVVQHMPEKFTAAFAARLDSLSPCEVREARRGDRVLPGRVLIAPGGRHMRLARSGAQYRVEIVDGPPVNRHRPSVDVLFDSVAKAAGANAVGIIMTGMGSDGARGLLRMRQAGAVTVAQDEASCVVFGMPKEAIALGAVQHVVPLAEIRNFLRASQ